MVVINTFEELEIKEKTSVALGNFDGIHAGHQKIFECALSAAKESGLKALCFTFSNHPFNFILGRDADDPAAIKLICSEEEKLGIVESMGFDYLVNLPFDENIMKMRAYAFFNDILVSRLNAGFISVGFNYTYGARAEGKPDMLRSQCEKAGIGINVHEPVMMDGKVVSSTLIREMISEGNMESVSRYLGRPLSFSGKVEHGRKLGSANGIPTANIVPAADRLLPPRGVYFTRTVVDGAAYCGVSNIGSKPTVQKEGDEVSIETNLFDYNDDLYGKDINVLFDRFSRPEVRFASKEDLFDRIRIDCAEAKMYYSL